ncbi:MAG TPA: sulfite reductase [Planctomycetaceae bacterium]|nr:sulfite reductase [Planctomycetaceae bacterium]
MPDPSSRRTFLAASAAAVSTAAFPWNTAAAEDSAAELISGKDERLIVLKPYPAVIETPLKLLTEHQLTPAELLFVRNNSQPKDAATISASTHRQWAISVGGAVSKTARIALNSLGSLPRTEYEMVLQCSGNGRSLFSFAAQTSGTQWGRGGMGNVKFGGVRLSAVLDHLGVEVRKSVRFVNAGGSDEPLPDKEDFLHSLPVEDVLNRSIIATTLNGKPLAAIHGGPARLITPGVFGTMQVKWLSELIFVAEESTNYNHVPRYRVPNSPIRPGTKYDFTLQNSAYNWDLKVKSVILNPNHGDALKAGENTIQGVAFNDGRVSISSVLLSFDKGQTWTRAELSQPESQYGWIRFSLKKKLSRGTHTIWSRAIDELGRTQPLDGSIAWNPRGYEWNGVEQIKVTVS